MEIEIEVKILGKVEGMRMKDYVNYTNINENSNKCDVE
jgi:hypothetical protein